MTGVRLFRLLGSGNASTYISLIFIDPQFIQGSQGGHVTLLVHTVYPLCINHISRYRETGMLSRNMLTTQNTWKYIGMKSKREGGKRELTVQMEVKYLTSNLSHLPQLCLMLHASCHNATLMPQCHNSCAAMPAFSVF